MKLCQATTLAIMVAIMMVGCTESKGGLTEMDAYVSEAEFEKNLARQLELSPQTVQQLYAYGVTGESELKLEFFFFTNRESNAVELDATLRQRGYDVESGKSAGNEELFLVTGWTTPIKFDEASVVQWTEEMCRIGFQHDSVFDGWGTFPNQ